MESMEKIKVLVVDDSQLFRKLLVTGISADPRIEVTAVAADPFEARDKILATRPDVITCDIEMPRMNGIDFIRQLLPQYFVPVIMVSAISRAVFEALEAGAVDFIAKPVAPSSREIKSFISDLVEKIKTASTIKKFKPGPLSLPGKIPGIKAGDRNLIIAIGASTGGTEAIYNLLSVLPPSVPGIVIVQHIPPIFSQMFAERLDSQTRLNVKEASTGDYVERGRVLIAPGNRHMRVKRAGEGYQVECLPGKKVNGHCPSVDVLFKSVAEMAGENAIGILLTGMGSDGAKGLLSIRRRGGRTIGQDRESSIVYGMPRVAFNIGAVEIQALLEEIPQVLSRILAGRSVTNGSNRGN